MNHSAPSGPAVMWLGDSPIVKPGVRPAGYSVIAPVGVIRPIPPLRPDCVNQRLPSGPVVMSTGALPGVRLVVNCVMPAEAAAGHASSATAETSSGRRRRVRIRGTGMVSAEPFRGLSLWPHVRVLLAWSPWVASCCP